jgi:hypothetical protein
VDLHPVDPISDPHINFWSVPAVAPIRSQTNFWSILGTTLIPPVDPRSTFGRSLGWISIGYGSIMVGLLVDPWSIPGSVAKVTKNVVVLSAKRSSTQKTSPLTPPSVLKLAFCNVDKSRTRVSPLESTWTGSGGYK